MLKIAEYNKITGKKIELSELEKFGFKNDKWWYNNLYTKVICKGIRGQQFEIIIDKNRCINGYSEGADGDGEGEYIDDTLYDLIEAGYVEKVEE